MKKYISHSLWLLIALTVFHSCQHDSLMHFNQKPDVYFTYLDMTGSNRLLDSAEVKFNNMSTSEHVILLPVTITGPLSDVDRYAAFTVDPNSTAIAGTHYEMPASITIPAGSTGGYLVVRLFRSPDLSENGEILKLTLRLAANEQFGTNYQARVLNTSTGEKRQVLAYSIYISDFLTKPLWWGNESGATSAFGTYSKTKFLKICEVNNFPPVWMDGEEAWNGVALGNNPTGTAGVAIYTRYMVPAAKRTTLWLNDYETTNGTPFLDENGEPMTMGARGQL